jgi:hypothetical protein
VSREPIDPILGYVAPTAHVSLTEIDFGSLHSLKKLKRGWNAQIGAGAAAAAEDRDL